MSQDRQNRVVRLKTISKPLPKAGREPSAKAIQAGRVERLQGYGYGSLATVMLAMSLDHQATGIAAATHCGPWEGWTMALAIDAGFVLCELAPFTCRATTIADTRIVRHAMSGVVLGLSAWFNTMAFSHGTGVGIASAGMGCLTPVGIAAFTFMAGRCLLGRSR